MSNGFPGHASIQINRPDTTTYLGLGPAIPGRAYATASYDIVTLPNGVSPVGVLRNPFVTAVPPIRVNFTTLTLRTQITDAQAEAALTAANNYQSANANYNAFNGTICTDYALTILKAAIPGSSVVFFDRVPSVLQQQLTDVANTGLFYGTAGVLVNPGLAGIHPDVQTSTRGNSSMTLFRSTMRTASSNQMLRRKGSVPYHVSQTVRAT